MTDQDHRTRLMTLLDEFRKGDASLEHGAEIFEKLIAERSKWRPMESAPTDRTAVLVLDGGIVSEAYFHDDDNNWWLAQTAPGDFDPTNPIYPRLWRPLPEPPALESTRTP